ncbi:MAG: protein kinase [Candidatus Wallbacteria bacterium]|nr:protein kinase [Candidatus Wallbacteria bacterium]
MKTLDTLKSFVILEELAHGGMGAVHVGYNPAARRLVAIKTLFKEQGKDKVYVERFRWEGDIYRRLSHPNIVGYVDMDEVEGVNFIAMEHVRGRPLDAILKEKGRLSWEESVRIAGSLADAMAHYHERKLLHRDIKPQNVLLTADGVVKLIDFGIAISLEQAAQPDGSIVGTFNYASPEQNQGRKLDERSDIYALGLMLYEMLTGKRVFPQTSLAEVSSSQLKADVPYPSAVESDVPKGLDKIVMKLIARDANARYQKAKELLADLELCKEDPHGFDPRSAFDDEGITAKWEQAKAFLVKKDFDQALRLAQVVLSRKSDSAEVHALLGKAHAGAGAADEAVASFAKAMELEPESDQHRLDYGIALYGLHRFDEASEVFQNILDLVPDNPYAKRYIGLCQQAKNTPTPATSTPAAGTPVPAAVSDPGAVKPVSAPGAVKPESGPGKGKSSGAVPMQSAPLPVATTSKAAYLWWGIGAFQAGKAGMGLVLSLLEAAILGAIALPWTPVWEGLVAPSGPLGPFFAANGPLAAAAPFKEWTVAGPALLIFLILELVVPPKTRPSS